MNFKHLSVLLLMFSLSAFPIFSKAQNGSITGTVKDKKTNETIVGANVVIQNTTTGASTDLNGHFTIANLKRGSYNLVISFISYTTVTIENVKVNADKATDLTIDLEESVASIEGVTVSARRLTNTDISMLNTIKKSEVVVSGISAQQIAKSQDKDASEVVKRISGVTVVNNRFIMIRGLNERYNAVLLHDASAPSMEADIRSFSFDVVPSSLIDRIMIFKSPAAELPGDFAGGLVKIYTKSIPEENAFEISYGASFREGSSFRDFYHQKNSSTYWTGFNDKQYNLPNGFPASLRTLNPDQIVSAGRMLPNSWLPEKSNSGLNHSVGATAAYRSKIGKSQFGSITSITYNNSKTIYDVKRYDYNQYDNINNKSSIIYAFNDRQYNQQIRTGILQNFAVRLNPSNTIEFKNLFNQISQAQYVERTGIHYDFGYVPNNGSFDQIYRGIYTGQLTGNHKLAGDKFTIDWVGNVGYSYRDEPDYRRYRADVDTITHTQTTYIPVGAASSYFLGRFYAYMKENNQSGKIDFTYKLNPLKTGLNEPVLKAGVLIENKDRSFDARNLGYTTASIANFDSHLQYVRIDSLFLPENINNTTGIRIDEQTNPSDSYTAAYSAISGYIQASFPITRKLSAVGGVRVEKSKQQLQSFTLTNQAVNVSHDTISVLPSVNITYNFSEKMLVRAAYGQTVNRPEFRELAPFGFYDFNYNVVKKGNENLNNATIHNIDVRWELYPTPNEIVTVGLFYKKFIHPIETLFIPGGGSGGIKDFSYGNAESAESMGVEAEVRKSLAGLTRIAFLDDLSVLFNTALIRSNVVLGPDAVRQSGNRPMQGQSPYIVNAGLFYKNMRNNIQATIMYNVIGKRIFAIGYDVYPDIYEMPVNLLDFTITKGIRAHLEIKAGASNLLNNSMILLQDANNDGTFSKSDDQLIQKYKSGSNYSLGISYKL